MRTYLFLGVVCGIGLMLVGCGSSDDSGGDSSASASSSGSGSAPPPPPSAPATASDPSTTAANPSAPPGAAQTSYPMGDGGTAPGADLSSVDLAGAGSTGAEGGAPADYAPPMDTPADGYGVGDGTVPGAATGYSGVPEGTEGYAAGGVAAPPPRPKSLRERALVAFREGKGDEAMELLSAHYLTNPSAGSELGRVMQWSPALRRPALTSRIGLIVVYSAPFNFEGNPQPLGSAELEAALGSQEKAGEGNREGGGGGVRRGGRRLGGGGNPPAGPPGGSSPEAFAGGSGYGGEGNGQLPTTPEGELNYFTGEIGTKLVAKIKSKLESGAFGAIYKEALKELPAEKADGENGQPDGFERMRMGAGAGFRPPGTEGGDEYAPDGAGGGAANNNDGGVLKGQLIPGVEFLGAVENMKELGETAKSATVDALVVFEVAVRPATASKFVNTDTKFRVVSAADPSKILFASQKLNNKQIFEARKKKSGEDPVAQEVDEAVAALETNFKLAPLPALTPELVAKRINFLIAQKPADATPLLLETRFFVVKKLLKPDEAVALTLNGVGEEQLDVLSKSLDGDDAREKIASAMTGKRADGPTTVLGKFGAAITGAGGLTGLAPEPRLPGIGGSAAETPAPGLAQGPGPGISGPPSGGGSGYGPGGPARGGASSGPPSGGSGYGPSGPARTGASSGPPAGGSGYGPSGPARTGASSGPPAGGSGYGPSGPARTGASSGPPAGGSGYGPSGPARSGASSGPPAGDSSGPGAGGLAQPPSSSSAPSGQGGIPQPPGSASAPSGPGGLAQPPGSNSAPPGGGGINPPGGKP